MNALARHGLVLALLAGVISAPAAALTEAECIAAGDCAERVPGNVSSGDARACALSGGGYCYVIRGFNWTGRACAQHVFGADDGVALSEAALIEEIEAATRASMTCECAGGGAPVPYVRAFPTARCGEWARLEDPAGPRECGTGSAIRPFYHELGGEKLFEVTNGYWANWGGSCAGSGDERYGYMILARVRGAVCPAGTTEDAAGWCRYDDREQAFSPGAQPHTDGAPELCPGHPIHIALASKVLRETDYRGAGPFALVLERYYASAASMPAAWLGPRWRHGYDRSLAWVTSLFQRRVAIATRADGRRLVFESADGGASWRAAANVRARLSRQLDDLGDPVGWALAQPTGTVEHYDEEGRLTAIERVDGLTQRLGYDPVTGLLATVTGPFGHRLRFEHEGARLARVIDPAGNAYAYGYDAELGRLRQVVYPDDTPAEAADNPRRRYLYEDGRFPLALTGIEDANGERHATYAYDGTGRAVSSTLAGGVGRIDVGYEGDGTVTVTDAAGSQSRYGLELAHRIKRPSSIDAPCAACRSQAAAYGYDANGFLERRTDFEGAVTETVRNASGQVQTRTEGLGSAEARSIEYQYLSPALDRVTRETRPSVAPGASAVTITDYGEFDRPTAVTERGFRPDGTPVTRNATRDYYDAGDGVAFIHGRLKRVDGPRSDVADVTTFAYYDCDTGAECGQLEAITDAAGHVTRFEAYDAHGRVTRMSAPNGLVTVIDYDPRGRPRTVTRKDSPADPGRTTTLTYWPTGRLKATVTPRGVTLTRHYDAAHRLARLTDSAGNRIELTPDPASRALTARVYDAGGSLRRRFTVERDAYDLVARITTPAGVTRLANDSRGNVTERTDPRDHTTVNGYDALHRLTTVTDALRPTPGVTAYRYDVHDRLTRVTDPRGVTTTFTYDDLGNLLEERSPDRGTRTYEPDAAGNVVALTDGRDVTATFDYDALDRLERTRYPDAAENVRYVYDEADAGRHGRGRLTTVTDASGATALAYDPAGHVVRREQRTGAASYVVGYGYDDDGALATMTYPSGHVVAHLRNANGETRALVLDPGPGETRLARDIAYAPFGPPTGLTYGNGLVLARRLDADHRLERLTLGPPASPAAVLHLDYAHDAAGNVTAITDVNVPARSQDFSDGYDPLDRLTRASGPYGARRYDYDGAGNRTRLVTDAAAGPFGPDLDRPDRRLAYDAAGRLARLRSGTVEATYRYNAFGERVLKAVNGTTTRYYYDVDGTLLGEHDGVRYREYVYLDGVPIAMIDTVGATTTVRYVHSDHLGTPLALTDAAATVVWRAEHAPFGQAVVDEDADGDQRKVVFNLRFPGQYYDAESGLHYNYQRYYDPGTGRYLTPDPIGLAGGINVYTYVGGNPIVNADPTGLVCGAGACVGAAALVVQAARTLGPTLARVLGSAGARSAGTGIGIGVGGSVPVVSEIGDADAEVENCLPIANNPAIPDVAPGDLCEQLALAEAKAGAGEVIITGLGDEPRLVAHYGVGPWVKKEHKHRCPDGRLLVIHYFHSFTTGENVELKFVRRM